MAVPPTRPTMIDPAKAALRAELRARRDNFVLDLGPARRARAEQQIADNALSFLDGSRIAAFYIALGSELDCAPLIVAARERGITIALPFVSARDVPMRFRLWEDGVAIAPGWKGLIQPHADAVELRPDLIFAPLLGFDSAMGRIGQGAAFYDRAFAEHEEARRIGLAWSVQEVAQVPRDPWDAPLDAVVTELAIFEGTRHK